MEPGCKCRERDEKAYAGIFPLLGSLLPLQFVLNKILDRLVRLIARKETAIDEDRRRSSHSGARSFLDVLLYCLDLATAVDALIELFRIQLHVGRALFQIGD